MTQIGERIRAKRKAMGLSQQRLAIRAGLSLNGVAQLEQGGRTDPRYSTLKKLAAALNVSLAELLGAPCEAAIAKAVPFLDEDQRLKQKVHNLGPYAYTHIDWAARQAKLEKALGALREAHAAPKKAKS